MDGIDSIFTSVMFCYFMDNGPCSIDLFFLDEIKENPDLTAVRLMTKSTALVRGDNSQQIEQSIIDQLSGPDIYPVDTKYRMVWYNWLITNRFSNDTRIRTSGAIAGIYCIYNKKNENIIRNTLEVIEKVLRNTTTELKSIDDIIRKKFQLSSSISINERTYTDFIKEKNSDIITKNISTILDMKIKEYIQKNDSNKRISQTGKFKIILQSMVFNKGKADEIVDQVEKRKYWNSVIKKFDQIIQEKLPNLMTKKTDMKELRKLYQLLMKEKIWKELLNNELPPFIQSKDIADFFLYYWLAHNQLLEKKKILQLYFDMTK